MRSCRLMHADRQVLLADLLADDHHDPQRDGLSITG